MNERVSIIVMTYNASKTVIDSLDSIRGQTWPAIELIVTDDHSTDDTVRLAEEWIGRWGERFSGARVVTSRVNTGITANVRRGVEHSTGDYLFFFAGDDLMEPDAIRRFLEAARGEPMTIFQSRVRSFYDTQGDRVFARTTDTFNRQNLEFLQMDQPKQYAYLLKRNAVHAPGAGLVPRDAYDGVGGIDTKYKMIDDYPLWLKLSKMGYAFRLLDEPLIDYRISENSITHKLPKAYLDDEWAIFLDMRMKPLLRSGRLATVARVLLRRLL